MITELTICDRNRAGELVSIFFGMVLVMCKNLGMDENDAIALFSKERIRGAYKIVAKRDATPPKRANKGAHDADDR